IDLDKLSADEKENWVWKGAECTPSLKRCLVSLSRGGGDAIVVREFDPASRVFLEDGFSLAEAKSSATYLDDDSVLFGTDFGLGSLTPSGYTGIVKFWRRGEPVASAKVIYEGKSDDVASQGTVVNDQDTRLAFVVRAVGFFETEYFLLKPDGSLLALPLPKTAI